MLRSLPDDRLDQHQALDRYAFGCDHSQSAWRSDTVDRPCAGHRDSPENATIDQWPLLGHAWFQWLRLPTQATTPHRRFRADIKTQLAPSCSFVFYWSTINNYTRKQRGFRGSLFVLHPKKGITFRLLA